MQRLRMGLCGAGLVGQAEHAFYLWEDRDRFDFVALADASPKVRGALGERYAIPHLCADMGELLRHDLDAVVICVPDAFHPELAAQAFGAGLHVMCEKPLALTLSGCDRMIAARDKAGRVGQLAYMKRYDPAFRAALDHLPPLARIRLISVEVNDPDQDPFVRHLPMVLPDDLPGQLREQLSAATREQLGETAGSDADDESRRALANGFLSAIVHDVAVVHGMLLHMGAELPARADFGARFDQGRGVQLGFPIPGGGRVSMTHLNLPGVADYRERITVYGDDRIVELVFPAPYLRNMPTGLTVRRTGPQGALETLAIRVGYEEAFSEELRAFHAAVTMGAPVATTFEQGRRDVELLISAFRRSLT
ncbi:Gfo/Idh/MocA family protein [Aestuariivirga sp.]|uniref:Gfo/Idh/MocA family protein n=1 Tax=Aestuariivirga sp. TaxID=2650926 RepID=UPI003BA98644